MINWDTILAFEKRPAISSLELSPIVVARDKKQRVNMYEDIVQIHETMFAAINRRSTVKSTGNDDVREFFWANEKESLFRGVYGDLSMPVTTQRAPPNELLITPGRYRYGELIEDAEAKKLYPSKWLIWSTIAMATGVCLSIHRCDYYFVCSQDESAEFKIWDDCQPVAIGFRTFLGKPLVG